MKRVVLCVIGVLQVGCILALQPWYIEKQVVMYPGLLGTWANPGEDTTWTFVHPADATPAVEPSAYQLITRDTDKGVTVVLDAHLFVLGNTLFLDVMNCKADRDADAAAYAVPGHFLDRARLSGDTLRLATFDTDWLDKLPEAERTKIGLQDAEGRKVFCAPTPVLQAFLREHAADTAAWGDETELRRQG